MKKIEDLQFPSSSIRALVREIKGDVYIQKGVLDLISKCAVVSTSFLACVSESLRKESNEKNLTYEHMAGVFEGLGLFELAGEIKSSQEKT